VGSPTSGGYRAGPSGRRRGVIGPPAGRGIAARSSALARWIRTGASLYCRAIMRASVRAVGLRRGWNR
jgi:hypothetical protein